MINEERKKLLNLAKSIMSVRLYKCTSCGYESFDILERADTDMVSCHCIGFYSLKNKTLVITEYAEGEMQLGKEDVIIKRVNSALQESDFLCLKLIYSKIKNRYLLSCPHCENEMCPKGNTSYTIYEFCNIHTDTKIIYCDFETGKTIEICNLKEEFEKYCDK